MPIGNRLLIILSLLCLIILSISSYILWTEGELIELSYKIILIGLIINSGLFIMNIPLKHLRLLRSTSLLKKEGVLMNGVIRNIEEKQFGGNNYRIFEFELSNKEVYKTPLVFDNKGVMVGDVISVYINTKKKFVIHKIGVQ